MWLKQLLTQGSTSKLSKVEFQQEEVVPQQLALTQELPTKQTLLLLPNLILLQMHSFEGISGTVQQE
jgi:hypothetical protein